MTNQRKNITSETNDKKTYEVDVVILGVGTCGEDLSLQLLDAGLDVVGIEPALIGGECAYYACLPTKAMLRSANALREARRVNKLAGKAEITPDWSPLSERVRGITGGWDDSGALERYKDRGGQIVRGHGRLSGPRTVTVGDESYRARRGVVIATGSKPAIPPISGLDEVDYWTTHDVIQLEELPESIIIIGGGATGCELGQVLSRFGVKVTIVEAGDRLLSAEEPEASEVVEEAFDAEGIEVKKGSAVKRVESRNGSVAVGLEDGKEIEGERLFLATGRTVDISDLGLESAGLDSGAEFIEVDERMQAGDGIWAMGDVTGKALYSHVALYQSAIIASEILDTEHAPAEYHAVPRGTFTDPEVGGVGMRESEAREAGLDIAVAIKQLPVTFRGAVHGAERGIIKLIADRDQGILVGATVAGPDAAEMLGLLNLAVHARLPMEELRSMIYAFPAFYSAIGEAIGAHGRGVTTVLDPDYKGLKELDEVGKAKV